MNLSAREISEPIELFSVRGSLCPREGNNFGNPSDVGVRADPFADDKSLVGSVRQRHRVMVNHHHRDRDRGDRWI